MILKCNGVKMAAYIVLLQFIDGPDNILNIRDIPLDQRGGREYFSYSDGSARFETIKVVTFLSTKPSTDNTEVAVDLEIKQCDNGFPLIRFPPTFLLRVYEIVNS